jgi:hypothetical protein
MRYQLLLLLSVLSFQPLQAQDDTAYQRGIYNEVNEHAGEYGVSEAKVVRPNDDQKYLAKIWWQAHTIRKLEVKEKQGDNQRTTEFYYNSDGILAFIFMVDQEAGTKVENRFYFSKNGSRLVKWLGADKKEVPSSSHDFDRMGEDLVKASTEFLEAIGE